MTKEPCAGADLGDGVAAAPALARTRGFSMDGGLHLAISCLAWLLDKCLETKGEQAGGKRRTKVQGLVNQETPRGARFELAQ